LRRRSASKSRADPHLRQSGGFVRSLLELMGVELPVPDHTTLARRRRSVMVDQAESPRRGPMDIVLDSTGLKFYGPGEWARAKPREKRRAWRKLHVAIDPDRGEIVAHELTDDSDQGGPAREVAAESRDTAAAAIDPRRRRAPWRDRVRAARRGNRPRWANGVAEAPWLWTAGAR
jgi:hypothetical protein